MFDKTLRLIIQPSNVVAALGLLVVAFAIFYGAAHLKQSFQERVENTALNTSKGVHSLINEKVGQYQLVSKTLANYHKSRIIELSLGAGYPYDLDEINQDIRRLFADVRQFAILDDDGAAKVGSDGYFLGDKCRNHILESTLEESLELDAELHQCQHGSHYDVIVKVKLGEEQASLYMSFYLIYFQKLLLQFETEELELFLVDPDYPNRVLLTPEKVAADEPLLVHSEHAVQTYLANLQLFKEGWRLIVRAKPGLLESYNQRIDWASWILFSLFLIIYLGFAYYLRAANQARFKAEQKSHYNHLFNAGPTVLFEAPLSQKEPLDYVSPNVEALLGFEHAQLMHKMNFFSLVSLADKGALQHKINVAKQAGDSAFEIEFRMQRADEESIWVYGLFQLNQSRKQGGIRLQGYLTSIDEQKVAEQQATTLIERAPNAILVTHIDGEVLQLNQMATRLFGYQLDEVNSLPVQALLPNLEVGQHFHRFRNETQEMEGRHKDGQALSVSISLTQLTTSQGKVVVIVARDIALQKQAEQQMRLAKEKAESLAEARTQFMAMVSHEIRTPMNGVLGMSDLLSGTRLDNAQLEYLHAIQQSSRSLIAILNDVLDFSKLDEGRIQLHKEAFDLRETIHSCVQLLSPQAQLGQVAVELNLPEQSLWYEGDATRIRQIVINLLGNAIKFSPQGQVTMSVVVKELSEETQRVSLVFKDTGIGISEDDQDNLFTPYTQADSSLSRKFGGTGLGLSISKQLVDLMFGEIEVESNLNRGSIFTVSLPLTVASPSSSVPAQREKKVEKPALMLQKPISVLLVEDDLVNLKIAETYLSNMGLNVSAVHNGLEAIEYWRMHQDSLDMVIMDCQMPVMDGYEASEIIRHEEALLQTRQPVVIIAFTANAYIGSEQEESSVSMDDYMVKPLQADEFKMKVNYWLEQIELRKTTGLSE